MKNSDYKEGITLVLTCSKPKILAFFFAGLRKMDFPREDIHLLIFDNTNSPVVLENIKEGLDSLSCPKCKKFRSIRLYKSFMRPRGILRGSGGYKFSSSKLFNIFSMWKKIMRMIYTETFFQLEDNGIYQPDAFKRLHKLLMSDSKVGFATAIETGRQPLPYAAVRCGVHKIIMRKGELLKRISLDPETKGVVPIDASGVYCFAARTKAYKTGFIDYAPVSKSFSMFAMDNVLTYNMKKHGWKLLADFDCWCGHMQVIAGKICIFGKDQSLPFVDVYLREYDAYAIAIEIKKPGMARRKYMIKTPAPCVLLHPEEAEFTEKEIKEQIKEAKKKGKKIKKKK